MELSRAGEGFPVLAGAPGNTVAHSGSGPPSAELVHWAEQAMLDSVLDEQTLMTEKVGSDGDSNYKVIHQTRYSLSLLRAQQNREQQLVAALVLGVVDGEPSLPSPAVIPAIGEYLTAEGVTALSFGYLRAQGQCDRGHRRPWPH